MIVTRKKLKSAVTVLVITFKNLLLKYYINPVLIVTTTGCLDFVHRRRIKSRNPVSTETVIRRRQNPLELTWYLLFYISHPGCRITLGIYVSEDNEHLLTSCISLLY